MKTNKTRILIIAGIILSALIILSLAIWAPVMATGQKTTCDVPTGPYPTIQSALNDSSCDIINLTAALYSEQLTINRQVIIQGQGMDDTVIDGSNNGRVIDIQNSTAVSLTSLTIANGNEEYGGGISAIDSSLTLSNVALISNTTPVTVFRDAGGIFIFANAPGQNLTIINSRFHENTAVGGKGGAIYLRHMDVTIENSSFTSNTAGGCGAIFAENDFQPPTTFRVNIANSQFISNTSGGDGGAICNSYNLTMAISNSLILSNTADRSGGGIFNDGNASLYESTVSGNTVTGSFGGGGIYNEQNAHFSIVKSTLSNNSATFQTNGGALVNDSGTMTITNSTISGNYARYGGGFYSMTNDSVTTILNSTITDNEAFILDGGGGIWSVGDMFVFNTIIANSDNGGDCEATFIVNANNLVEDGSCNATYSGDPLLGPLQDNGGPTWTHELLEGSPALETANNNVCPSIDQRGNARPADGNNDGINDCDIGAYEHGVPALPDNLIYMPAIQKP